MRKSELIKEIAHRTGAEKGEVEKIVETLMSTVIEQVIGGENVSFNRFGTFALKKRKPKIARDINKNTRLYLPERYIVKFSPAKNVLDKVKNQVLD
jgi:DNA-binding protein HU-beta